MLHFVCKGSFQTLGKLQSCISSSPSPLGDGGIEKSAAPRAAPLHFIFLEITGTGNEGLGQASANYVRFT